MSKKSAYTSLNHVPAVFKKYQLGGLNLDIGGGKYDTGSDYLLKSSWTFNLIYDPYNRTPHQNASVVNIAYNQRLDSITCLNVLNVIKSKKERIKLLENIKKYVHRQKHKFNNDVVVIFSVYQKRGDGKANGKLTQNNMKAADYIPEIQEMFPKWEVQQQGNVLIV